MSTDTFQGSLLGANVSMLEISLDGVAYSDSVAN
jgi:hypothetical protein